MTAVAIVCAVMLTVGTVLSIARAEKGPSMLDRTIALDIVVTMMIAGVALYAAVHRRTDVVPVLVVLSLVGFVGSVTVARFASVEPEGEGRVRTREEIAAEESERRRVEAETEERRRAWALRRAQEREHGTPPGPQPGPDDAPEGNGR
ncbi:monovalent cation/H+ antiporter complex subunit F [Cellulomonas soli]|uniref:monovalent cation/H+ antiporter complex subunit F n=1 Tax=Cellulomonas soli TaxID=931535 RepID=UPI003F87D7E0